MHRKSRQITANANIPRQFRDLYLANFEQLQQCALGTRPFQYVDNYVAY